VERNRRGSRLGRNMSSNWLTGIWLTEAKGIAFRVRIFIMIVYCVRRLGLVWRMQAGRTWTEKKWSRKPALLLTALPAGSWGPCPGPWSGSASGPWPRLWILSTPPAAHELAPEFVPPSTTRRRPPPPRNYTRFFLWIKILPLTYVDQSFVPNQQVYL
jgi:hypothetical protein